MAVLHLELIQGTTSRAEIDEVLDAQSVQGSLHAIYDQTVARIHNQNVFQARLGKAILKWVYCTSGSLTKTALFHALALDPALVAKSPKALEEKHMRPEKAITMFCASLVMIEPTSNLVRFKHYTTQQYFQSRPDMFPNVDFEIAKTALRYFQLGMLDQEEGPNSRLFDAPHYGEPPINNTYNLLINQNFSQFPLLDFINSKYKSLLVVQLQPEHVQDKILKAIFTDAPSLDIYGSCNTEVRNALRDCLCRLLRSPVPFGASDIALFLHRGVIPSSDTDLESWGPPRVSQAISEECVPAVQALIEFGVRVDKSMVEQTVRKFHENNNLTRYLIRSDCEYILDRIADIRGIILTAWEKQNPHGEMPSYGNYCDHKAEFICECSTPVKWLRRI